MMFVPATVAIVATALVQVVSGHFSIIYPEWRADTIELDNDTLGISQWNYPCMYFALLATFYYYPPNPPSRCLAP